MGFDLLPEIGLILDNTSDDQTHSAQTSNLDGQMNTFVRVDSTEENQVITAGFLKRVQREIDAVVDGRQVIQPCGSVGVADGNEVSVTILMINGHDFGRRESVDGSQDRCSYQPGVGQSHEVVVAVEEIKLSSVLEGFRDVKVFGYFGIDGGILFTSLVHDGMQASAGH